LASRQASRAAMMSSRVPILPSYPMAQRYQTYWRGSSAHRLPLARAALPP